MSITLCTIPAPFPAKQQSLYLRPLGLQAARPVGALRNGGNGLEDSREKERGLDILYNDHFGSVSMNEYFTSARTMLKDDGGPPRWFCPIECGRPAVENAPRLLFLPGICGVGMELIFHHRTLGKVFEVCCLHIPINNRTPFEGLLEIIEESIKLDPFLHGNRPTYIIGYSFGGALAISVAARNPEVNFILILANPAISLAETVLHPILLRLLENVPSDLQSTLPYLLTLGGGALKMAIDGRKTNLSLTETFRTFSATFTSLAPLLSELGYVIQKDTMMWKLKLLNSGAVYARSFLHALQAEVLLLCSDNLLRCGEAKRLLLSQKSCKVRYLGSSSERILLDDSINILTVIKGAKMYRRGSRRDNLADYLPPTLSEFHKTCEDVKPLHQLLSPVMLSTLKNGKIVRGLAGVPENGPVLLVGYHVLMALELTSLHEEFLREKKVMLRAMYHPAFFGQDFASSCKELSFTDLVHIYGGLPVSAFNMHKLFERKEFVLLYPGGAREALHRKGEEYRLFWPDQAEFVRIASKFGVTVIPFGCVGEDDLLEIVFDYNDQIKVPFLRGWIKSLTHGCPRVRNAVKGEDGSQDIHLPVVVPKVPGRLYYLLGKPIEMKDTVNVLTNKKIANEVYMNIKSEVENTISYLKRKREEDPYRSLAQRTLYQATWGSDIQIPTFEP